MRVAIVITHSPDLVGRNGCCPAERVVVGAGVGALNYIPIATVPVLYQRLRGGTAEVVIVAHSPNISGRCGRYPIELTFRAGVGAWHNAPTAPVPVLYQRLELTATAVVIISQSTII